MPFNSMIIDSSDCITELCELGKKFPTDKSPLNHKNQLSPDNSGHRHAYTAVYDLLFSGIKYNHIKLAEIGILNNMSMRCWRQYFHKAQLFGFDFNQKFLNKAQADNLIDTKYEFINVKDANSIEFGLNKYSKYDIIIEDSTHEFEDQVRVGQIAHKYLNIGGRLIIEDIFRNIDHSLFYQYLSKIQAYYSSITFITTKHTQQFSGHWNNDQLLVLTRNNYYD